MVFKAGRALRLKDFINTLSGDSLDILYFQFINGKDEPKKRKQVLLNDLSSLPEKELQLINDIGTEKYHHHLVKACIKHKVDFNFPEMTAEDIAVRLFFHYNDAFKDAYNLCHIEEVEIFKEYKGELAKDPNNNNSAPMLIEIEGFLKEKGKGKKATAEIYSYPDKFTYIIKYGDVKKNYDILEDMTFKKVQQRLAKQIIILYNHDEGRLKIHAPNDSIREKAVSLFSKHILEDEEFFKNADSAKYYDLSRIFELTEDNLDLDPAEVESVRITELTAKDSSNDEDKTNFKSNDVLKFVEKRDHNSEFYIPEKVRIAFKLKGYGRQNRRTIEISNRTTNLNDSPRDEFIQKLLIIWGIIVVER
ncbi:MAG: hypothetical protein V2B14_04055 [bacterium]